jgi:type IV pilus assembly protein PilC
VATYVFKAMDLAGASSKGELEAPSSQAVADQLKARGLVVLEVAAKGGAKGLNLTLWERVKPADLTVMTRQLSTMVSSGMSLLRSLHVLEAQTESTKLAGILAEVRQDVEGGTLFSVALEKHPKVFGPLYTAMVRAGETGGLLESSLLRVADQLEKDNALRRQVKAAMMYPAVVITFAVIVLLGLVGFIVPVFAKIFTDFGGQLPGITRVTVGVSHLVTGYWYVLFGGAFGLAFGFRKWRTSARGRGQWDAFRLHLPMKIGDIVQKIALARWSRTFSSLTAAGVPILQALEITGQTAGNTVVDRAMGSVIASVKAGGTIAEPLKAASVFPSMVAHMIAVGEETGALETMLSKIADFYEDEVEAAVKALTSILEPVMIVVVGGIVGFVVVSMYLPMFKVYDQIK